MRTFEGPGGSRPTLNPLHRDDRVGARSAERRTGAGSERTRFDRPRGSRASRRHEERLRAIASTCAHHLAPTIRTHRRALLQARYRWSDIGEDGVLIGDSGEPHVFKFAGFDASAAALDHLAEQFGFTSTNARVVDRDDEDLIEALGQLDGNDERTNAARATDRILKMERVVGTPLHEQIDLNGDDKVTVMNRDLGRMVVMDLVTRNNDRFNLTRFDDLLLATDDERQADEAGWRPWMANEGNILVDEGTGHANPVDSQFTAATDEGAYAANVAMILTDQAHVRNLVLAVRETIEGVDRPANDEAILSGIEDARRRLLAFA